MKTNTLTYCHDEAECSPWLPAIPALLREPVPLARCWDDTHGLAQMVGQSLGSPATAGLRAAEFECPSTWRLALAPGIQFKRPGISHLPAAPLLLV
jgi:hypothetical protein